MSERGRAHKRDRENSDEDTAKIRRLPVYQIVIFFLSF